ncbi:MAG: hypothetical protein K1X89_12820 [Myxococcaceae bacterium]|nr:hypothetical protein [Myxococcaceae bacterium]
MPSTPPIAQYVAGQESLAVFEDGFSLRQGALSFEGGFDDLQAVTFSNVRLKVQGAHVSDVVHLTLTLRDGRVFKTSTYKQESRTTCLTLVARSGPALAARALAAFRRGEALDFGAVKLENGELRWKTIFGAKVLPLAELAAFDVRDGALMVDRDPESPHLVGKWSVGAITNLAGLTAVLAHERPEADLSIDANREQVKAKAGQWFFSKATAATHYPGGPTARTRLAILFALPGLALLALVVYALVSLPSALKLNGLQQDFNARFEKLVAQAKAVPPGGGEQPLSAACAGKLEAGAPGSLVVWFGPLREEWKSKLYSYNPDVPIETLVGLAENGTLKEEVEHDTWGRRRKGLRGALSEVMYHGPEGTARVEADFAWQHVPVSSARFLAVVQVKELAFEAGSSTLSKPVSALYDVAVLRLPDGATVCRGSLPVNGARPVKAESDWNTKSAFSGTPFLALCEAGGSELCAAAGKLAVLAAAPAPEPAVVPAAPTPAPTPKPAPATRPGTLKKPIKKKGKR